MISAVVLALLAPQTVTFEHPCASAKVVLEALGKAAGEKLASGGSVALDYFGVRFSNRSIEDVRRVIAETLGAVWVRRGEYLVLDRSPALEAKELDDESSLLRVRVAEYLQKNPVKQFDIAAFKGRLTDLAAAGSDLPKQTQARGAMRALMPEVLLKPALVGALGPDVIVLLGDGEQKTLGAATMPRQVRSVLDQFVKDSEAATEAAEALGLAREVQGGSFKPGVRHEFEVRISRQYGNVGVYLVRHSTNSDSVSMAASFTAEPWLAPIQLAGLEGLLDVPEPAKSLVSVVASRGIRAEDNNGRPSAEERATSLGLVHDLTANELLGIYGDLPLRAATKKSGRDYVALLPDGCAGLAPWMRFGNDSTLSRAWTAWAGQLRVSEDKATGILIVRPPHRKEARDERFDRSAASGFIKRFHTDGHVTLSSLARLALECRSEVVFTRTATKGHMFLPVELWNGSDWAALRAFASLRPEQQRVAEADGVVVPWKDLPLPVKEAVAATLMSNDTSFSEKPPERAPWIGGGGFGVEDRLDAVRLTSIPPGTELRVFVSRRKLMKARSSGVVPGPLLSPSELAMFATRGQSEGQLDYQRIALVNVERVDLEVFVPGRGYAAFYAQADDATHGTKYLAYGQLPEPFKSQVAEEMKKQRSGGG